jgi:hypothetical protein
MTDPAEVIARLLDEAQKAQRKGHLVLAQVCRDASDQLGLLYHAKADRQPLQIVVVLEGGVVQAVVTNDVERSRAAGVEVRILDYEVEEADANAMVRQSDDTWSHAWVYDFAPTKSDIEIGDIKEFKDDE